MDMASGPEAADPSVDKSADGARVRFVDSDVSVSSDADRVGVRGEMGMLRVNGRSGDIGPRIDVLNAIEPVVVIRGEECTGGEFGEAPFIVVATISSFVDDRCVEVGMGVSLCRAQYAASSSRMTVSVMRSSCCSFAPVGMSPFESPPDDADEVPAFGSRSVSSVPSRIIDGGGGVTVDSTDSAEVADRPRSSELATGAGMKDRFGLDVADSVLTSLIMCAAASAIERRRVMPMLPVDVVRLIASGVTACGRSSGSIGE